MAPRMTTSSYAVLGLLSLRPWSAYELARQAERSLRFAWPKSERHLYTEPKKLVALGHATVREEPAGPSRTRKIYDITDRGRDALARWASSPPATPAFEAETMVRLLFAEHGSIDDLTGALAKLKTDTQELHTWSLSILDGYERGDVPFPECLHVAVLLATFQIELFTLIERWTDYAVTQVDQWTSTADPGPDDPTPETIRLLNAGHTVLDHSDPA
jgi:DNA-binding PadR family transcriptional regulator